MLGVRTKYSPESAEGLTALGAFVTEREDGLTVHGGGVAGGAVDGYGDHRMVMLASIAATKCEQPIEMDGIEAIDKSWPEYLKVYQMLGGKCE